MRDLEKNLIAKIHLAKKDLGFDDDRYRALLLGVTGKDSCKDMTHLELNEVMDAFYKEGFVVTVKKKPSRSGKPTATRVIENTPLQKKIWALWYALADRGLVDRNKKALNGFIKKQCELESIDWCKADKDARKVIEGLKSWAKNKGVTLK